MEVLEDAECQERSTRLLSATEQRSIDPRSPLIDPTETTTARTPGVLADSVATTHGAAAGHLHFHRATGFPSSRIVGNSRGMPPTATHHTRSRSRSRTDKRGRRVTIDSAVEKWRYRCLAPDRYGLAEGHTNWFPIDGVFRCRSCAEQARTDPAVDPEYAFLRDTRTGELVARDDIRLAPALATG